MMTENLFNYLDGEL